MTKIAMAWYAQFDCENEDGTFGEEPEQRQSEIAELAKMGAPDTEQIEIISIEPEDREDFIVEALVTPAFAEWAKAPSKGGLYDTNLPILD